MGVRVLAFCLYLPPLLAVLALVFRTIQLAIAGNPASLFGLLYAGVLWLLGRRAARVVNDASRRPWADVALLSLVDLLLLGLALTDHLR